MNGHWTRQALKTTTEIHFTGS